MVAKLISRALTGFVLGMLVGVFAAIADSFVYGQGTLILPDTLLKLGSGQAGALLIQMLASGAFGIIPMSGTVFYEFDSWSMLKQSVVHYVSYTIPFLCLGVFLGWFEPTPADLCLMAGMFAVGHCVIWLIMYARYRMEVKKLNTLLSESKTA